MSSLASLVLVLSHLLVTWLPLIAALRGMVLVAYHHEWLHHRRLVREAALAPAARVWLVVERHRAERIRPHISCQELILRRYAPC
jgi:hypothetical protein